MKKTAVFFAGLLTLLLLTGCAAPASPSPPDTESDPGVITLKFAHTGSETSNINLTALYFKDDLFRRSGGTLVVEVYPDGQFGGDIDNIEALQNGENAFDLCSSSALVLFEPKMAVFDLPFLFQTKDTPEETMKSVFRALDSAEAKEALRLTERNGIIGMSYSGYGFRELTSNKIILSLECLSGLKIRTMENRYSIATWRALGADPTPMSYPELYNALKQKIIDAQENPLELIYSSGFCNVQKYIINTNHIHGTFVFQMSKKIYDSLSTQQQTIVWESVLAATEYSRSLAISSVSEIIAALKANGNEFIDLPAEELQRFKEATQPIWNQIRADIGDDIVNKIVRAAESAQ